LLSKLQIIRNIWHSGRKNRKFGEKEGYESNVEPITSLLIITALAVMVFEGMNSEFA
jgi:hypothetical protein